MIRFRTFLSNSTCATTPRQSIGAGLALRPARPTRPTRGERVLGTVRRLFNVFNLNHRNSSGRSHRSGDPDASGSPGSTRSPPSRPQSSVQVCGRSSTTDDIADAVADTRWGRGYHAVTTAFASPPTFLINICILFHFGSVRFIVSFRFISFCFISFRLM